MPARPPWLIPLLLFLATLVTTTLTQQSVGFAATLMSILVAHEMGHYLMARYHRVPASLPRFIPLPFLFGTLGAVISLRTDQADRNQLVDIGAAGPIAGFIVAVPALIIGVLLSHPVPLIGRGPVSFYGNSLLTKLISIVFGPAIAPGWDLEAHPVFVGAWVGVLVTAINLLPMGQLDGGHVLYGLSPEHAERWARRTFRALIGLGLIAFLVHLPSFFDSDNPIARAFEPWTHPLRPWFPVGALVWALFGKMTGLRHPTVRDESKPLTPGRRRLAFACLAILLLCYMPNPMYEDQIDAPSPAQSGSSSSP